MLGSTRLFLMMSNVSFAPVTNFVRQNIQHDETQYKKHSEKHNPKHSALTTLSIRLYLLVIMLSVIMVSVSVIMLSLGECHYSECHYVECNYDECNYVECTLC
jgi:hypothetical protein